MRKKNGLAEWSAVIMILAYLGLHIPLFFALKNALEMAMW